MRVEHSFDEKEQSFGTKPASLHGSTRSTLNDAIHKPIALPMCSDCTSATPKTSKMFLNNERVQDQLLALKQIVDGIDLVSYNQPPLSRTLPKEPSNVHDVADDKENLDMVPCVLCTTKKALPAMASLLLAMKSVWKEQTAGMTKAEKKVVKGELKAQARDMKKEFKKAKKLAKKERKDNQW